MANGTTNLTGLEVSGAVEVSGVVEASTVTLVGSTATDGRQAMQVAVATFDATGGKATGSYGLGVTLPAKAVILDGMVDVGTTFTSATDAATIAIQVESSGDIVAAIAISDASNPWDAGRHDIIPDGTASNAVKTTQAREITVVVGTQALTAGKLKVFLRYALGC